MATGWRSAASPTDLLGGSAKGKMHLEGRKKALHIDIAGTNVLLERWFKERSRDIPFTGGPMAITASLSGTGNSVRDLARSMTGPLTIRMGPGVYTSQKAGEAEAKMVNFSTKDAKGGINFECAGADLGLRAGTRHRRLHRRRPQRHEPPPHLRLREPARRRGGLARTRAAETGRDRRPRPHRWRLSASPATSAR
jgi:hypothetical protein